MFDAMARTMHGCFLPDWDAKVIWGNVASFRAQRPVFVILCVVDAPNRIDLLAEDADCVAAPLFIDMFATLHLYYAH